MKRIDKLAIALVIAWILQAVLTSLIPLSHLFLAVERVALGVVCGGWLYGEAKRERETAWLWCLVGFFGSLSALILFYVYMMWQQSQNPRPAANNSPETNALGGP